MTTVDEVCLMVTGISSEEPYPPHPDYPHLYSRARIQNTLITYINLNPQDNNPTQCNTPISPPDTTTSSEPTTPPSSSPPISTMLPRSSSLHTYTKLSLTLSLTLVLTLLLFLCNSTCKATPSILVSTHDTPTTYHHPISLLTLPYLYAIPSHAPPSTKTNTPQPHVLTPRTPDQHFTPRGNHIIPTHTNADFPITSPKTQAHPTHNHSLPYLP